MAQFKNTFSWSASRDRLFRSCKRAYYYNYYGYWNGWSRNAEDRVKYIYLLKKLQSLPLWAGSMVHDVIQEALERNSGTGHPIKSAELQARARTRLRRGWIESTSQEWQANKKATNLFELFHGNGKNLPKEDTEKVKHKVYSALQNFAESKILQEILSVPPFHWKPVDALGSYILDDIKVWVAIDFAYNDPNGHLHIIDWKTGKENTDELFLQLAGYAFYANNQWGAPTEKIKMCGVYLNENARVSHYTVTEAQVLQARAHILSSSREMYALLDDIQSNKASEENFAPEPVEWRCRNCNFKTICPAMKDQCSSILNISL